MNETYHIFFFLADTWIFVSFIIIVKVIFYSLLFFISNIKKNEWCFKMSCYNLLRGKFHLILHQIFSYIS